MRLHIGTGRVVQDVALFEDARRPTGGEVPRPSDSRRTRDERDPTGPTGPIEADHLIGDDTADPSADGRRDRCPSAHIGTYIDGSDATGRDHETLERSRTGAAAIAGKAEVEQRVLGEGVEQRDDGGGIARRDPEWEVPRVAGRRRARGDDGLRSAGQPVVDADAADVELDQRGNIADRQDVLRRQLRAALRWDDDRHARALSPLTHERDRSPGRLGRRVGQDDPEVGDGVACRGNATGAEPCR